MKYQQFSVTVMMFVVCTLTVDDTLCSPSARLAHGRLIGSWMQTRGGRRVAAFRGVPYALPPIDELRFRSPQLKKPLQGTKLARRDGHPCVQHQESLDLIIGQEDCLYLNIFTPKVEGSLPVLFFIHGGFYRMGSHDSLIYGPKYLLDEDIVLVTINYRLGVFGFLSLEDPALPGNLGLKDQRVALRWVRDNIAQFGGDPARVTIFGESAGAKSAHLHMLFNNEEGLFRAAILHSGSAFSGGTYQRPGDQKPLVEHLLNQTKCAANDKSSVVECLRKVRANKLARMVVGFNLPSDSLKKRVQLAPVIEQDCIEDAFITEDPWNRTSSLPLLIGTNKYEGFYSIVDLLTDKSDKKFKELNRNYEEIIPYNLMFDSSAEDPLSVVKNLKSFYLQDKKFDRDHVLQLVAMMSDGLYKFGAAEAVRLNSNKTYFFSFNYLGSRSILTLFGYNNTYGPSHVDELFMFFPFSVIPSLNRNANKTADVRLLSTQMIKMWTNFITYLEPTPEGSSVEWTPVSTPGLQYLDINGPSNFSMQPQFLQERMDFWASLPYRNQPLMGLPDCLQ